jgi:hypothetical protein
MFFLFWFSCVAYLRLLFHKYCHSNFKNIKAHHISVRVNKCLRHPLIFQRENNFVVLRFDFRLLCGPSVLKIKSGASSETLVTTYNILWHHTTDHERKNIRAKKKITDKSFVVNDQQNASRSQWVLSMYSKFTPTCFGKWLPSSGGRRCLLCSL